MPLQPDDLPLRQFPQPDVLLRHHTRDRRIGVHHQQCRLRPATGPRGSDAEPDDQQSQQTNASHLVTISSVRSRVFIEGSLACGRGARGQATRRSRREGPPPTRRAATNTPFVLSLSKDTTPKADPVRAEPVEVPLGASDRLRANGFRANQVQIRIGSFQSPRSGSGCLHGREFPKNES